MVVAREIYEDLTWRRKKEEGRRKMRLEGSLANRVDGNSFWQFQDYAIISLGGDNCKAGGVLGWKLSVASGWPIARVHRQS